MQKRKLLLSFSFFLLFGAVMLSLVDGVVAEEKESRSTAGQSVSQAKNMYNIGLADALEIIVWKEPDLSRQVVVRIDGKISLPLIGDVDAAGKTLDELTDSLKEQFKKVVADPSVTVILVQSRSQRYYVIGKVNQPGEFTIENPITVLQAIARSGGFAEWAEADDVSIVRRGLGGEKILHFDYEAFVKGKNPSQNVLIQSGDTIIVP